MTVPPSRLERAASNRGDTSSVIPDAVGKPLLLQIAPRSWQPFLQLARLDRPIGYWLLVLPCWWSSALASLAAHRSLRVDHLLLFLVGAIVMRGSGSTYNDIVDRNLDAKVERTKNRPIPSGRVTVGAARMFLVALAVIGFAVVLQFNTFTILLGTGSLAIVAIYPFMKRVTSWPQLVLGFAFAWGALVGWAAQFDSIGAAACLLYAGACLWTISYDTIYAVQDMRDDPAAGIKSTARLFGRHLNLSVGLLYALAVVLIEASIVASGQFLSLPAQLGVAAFACHLGWQVHRLDQHDPNGALALFRSNRNAGLLLFAGLAIAALVEPQT